METYALLLAATLNAGTVLALATLLSAAAYAYGAKIYSAQPHAALKFYGRTARLFLYHAEDPADGRAISANTLRSAASEVEQAPLPFAHEPQQDAPVASAPPVIAAPVPTPPAVELPQITRTPPPDSGLELVETRTFSSRVVFQRYRQA